MGYGSMGMDNQKETAIGFRAKSLNLFQFQVSSSLFRAFSAVVQL